MSASRADRLAELVTASELDALVVTNLINVRYLSGFTGTNGFCVVGDGLRLFLTDFRYVERAKHEVTGFEQMRGQQDLFKDAVERLAESGAKRVGFEDHHVSVRQHARFAEALPNGLELSPAGDLVEGLRAVKDADELRTMREAAAAGTGILEHLRARGLTGRSERDVVRDIEREMRERGLEPSFPPIVAAGANGALPHATPSEEPIPADTLVVVDLGCVVDGYCSDCTRTFATGRLSDDAAGVYELVRAAQARARSAVEADAGCRAVDSLAREMIADAGHGDRFGHGLGHGVGLEVHEAPRLSQAGEGELVAGNAVTVEPGVYVPGAYGVRIEDLVVVVDGGCEVLTSFPKELITLE